MLKDILRLNKYMYIILYILLLVSVKSFNLKYNFKVPFICEVHNLDIRNLDLGTIEELQYLFRATPVLVFKNQKINPKQQYDFTCLFDSKHTNEIAHLQENIIVPSVPQIELYGKGYVNDTFGITNKNLHIPKRFKYNKLWRQDLVGVKNRLPALVSSKYFINVSEDSGSTLFASMEKGYENMVHNSKNKLLYNTLQSIYSNKISKDAIIDHTGYSRIDKYWPSQNDKHPITFLKELDKFHDDAVVQPLIIYPDNRCNKKTLLLNPSSLFNFIGYSPRRSQDIIRDIMNNYVLLENNIGEIKNKKNDLLVFNNRKVIYTDTPGYEIEDNYISSTLFLDTKEKFIKCIK